MRKTIPRGVGLGQYDAKEVSEGTSTHTGSETMVQQHLKNEVDVNTIVRRFASTGEMPFAAREGVYGDFTGITDYESARARVEQADSSFMLLPAEVRERFQNSPAELLRYMNSVPFEEFIAHAEGLVPAAVIETPQPVVETPGS